jgi:hypothetical protein
MPAPEDLATLAADLGALTGRQRREVLAALQPFERARVEALLEAARAPADAETAPREPDYTAYSPWLAKRLLNPDGLTAATQRLLATIAAEAVETPAPAIGRAENRSLLSAFAGLFPARKPRP